MTPGDADAWRTATFALVGIILVGSLLLRRDRRAGTLALIALAAVVVLILAILQARFGSSAASTASMTRAPGVAPVPVTFARVRDSSGTMRISAPGEVVPYLTQDIATRADGLVTDFSAYTGDRLSAGDVVARLREPELQSEAQAAAADAQAAQSNVTMAGHDVMSARADIVAKGAAWRYWESEITRERTLLAEGAVSRRAYEDERARTTAARSAYRVAIMQLASARAGVEQALAQAAGASATARARAIVASYTNVVVPDDSVVVKRLVDPGVYVPKGTPILRVAVLRRLRVRVQVAQSDLAYVGVGTPLAVMLRDGRVLDGRVSSISPVADPQTHTALAEAIVPRDRGELVPGGYARVVLRARAPRAAHPLSVPSAAVVGGATPAVWVDRRGNAHRIAVSVLADDGITADVTGDLRAGMRVVVTGASGLEEGQAIARGRP